MIVKKDFLEVYNFNTGFFKQYRHQRQKKQAYGYLNILSKRFIFISKYFLDLVT